jgi:putative Holliday junction resolvase
MSVFPLEPALEAIATLPRGRRALGFDLGTKTIGLALSDVERRIATPLETIARTKFARDVDRLEEIVRRFDVGGLVLGLPVNMNGSEGPRAQATRAFARNLVVRLSLPLAFWDERLSTAAVERAMIVADTSRARRAEIIDRTAAAYILQGALDRMQAHRQGLGEDLPDSHRLITKS